MCGICGIVGPAAAAPSSEPAVRAMMDALRHRGPDDEGVTTGDNFIFGHNRLAIIDLEHGRQPMQSEDGAITLVYNGELYNYIELRQELARKGAHFKTFSDTEVLLKLYEYDGIDCLQKMNGMFAFAIYDARKRRFFAARDHFGIKPLYYTVLKDGSIAFASEIKALLIHPDIRPELNAAALDEYLTFQFCLGAHTLFRNVLKLEPAHYITQSAADTSPSVRQYWRLSYQVDTHHTEEYFFDKLLLLLQDSIRGQLRSDVPLGGYLSGGLDSSTVVTLATQQYGPGFKCFTGKFDEGPAYDESRYAKAVAAQHGCHYEEVVPTARDFVDTLPKLIYHMDEPAAGPGLFPQYMVSKLAKAHVKVVLGGQGGDEVFGGYARYLVAYLEQCIKGSIFETQEEGRHIVTLDSIIPSLSMLKEYTPLLKTFWQDGLFDPMDARYFRLIDRSKNLDRVMHPDVYATFDRNRVFAAYQAIFNSPETQSYLNKMTDFDQKALLPALLQVEDRVSMAVSLESRVPLLDHRIVQLVTSMPPTIKFKNGRTKFVLKKAMGSMLPGEVLDRKDKMGFPVPLNQWWRGPLKEFIADILLSKTCRERNMFNPDYLDNMVAQEGQFGRQVWGALCLELWHRAFIDQ